MPKIVEIQIGQATAIRALVQIRRNVERRSRPPLGPMNTSRPLILPEVSKVRIPAGAADAAPARRAYEKRC
jgi:hypothetical protein